jgi:peroxiredoxin
MTRNRKSLLLGIFGGIVAAAGIIATLSSTLPTAQAAARPGEPAPAFSVADTAGKVRTLDEFKGKYVVLEWINHDCPFVKKHYNSGNMQKLQSDLTADGVIWLSVNSSNVGQQGHTSPEQTEKLRDEKKAKPTAILLDTNGVMGKAYGAKTTPHMFIINPQGQIVYNGAIDDKKSADPADIPNSKNYVRAAYEQVKKGEAVTTATSQPYGCSVKY